MTKRTVKDLDVAGKKVIVRCDFNVPRKDGVITDDNRIVMALPTIKYLVENKARVILMSHLGKVKTEEDKAKNNLECVAVRLQELLPDVKVTFCPVTRGEELENAVNALADGEIVLMQNTRYEKGLGFLVEKEVTMLGKAVDEPAHPFVAIIGGSKVSSKIDVVDNLLKKADKVIIGGGMAYTFSKAVGGSIGTSLVEDDKLDLAKEYLEKAGDKLVLPVDNVIADAFSEEANTSVADAGQIPDGWMGLDIGPKSVELFKETLAGAKTVVWNGPMGVFEMPKFAKGTEEVCKAISELPEAITVIGGGDSAAAAKQLGYADKFSHVSTGGGASLEYMEGKTLPGIAIISEK